MGEYVGRIYDETRNRPKFIVESQWGIDDDAPNRVGDPVESARG
jgi:hypothetical protein